MKLISPSMAALWLAALIAVGCAKPEASPPAQTAAPKQPESAEDFYENGRQASARGDVLRAEQYFALALQHGYDRGKVVRSLVEVCVKSSRLRAALLYAEPYLRDHPDDHELRYLVAAIHWALGEGEIARKQLALLVHLAPTMGAPHYLLGVLDTEEDPDKAVRHFEQYLEVEPRGSRAAEVRGRLAELRVDFEEMAHEERQ